MNAAVLEFESGEKVVITHGRRPEIKAVRAHVEPRAVAGVMTNVGVPAVAPVPAGPHRLILQVQGVGEIRAYLTAKEALELSDQLALAAGEFDQLLGLEEALAAAEAKAATPEAVADARPVKKVPAEDVEKFSKAFPEFRFEAV